MSSGENDEENNEGIEPRLFGKTDPVSWDERMSLACQQGRLDTVKKLLESGAHIDYRNKAGNTPLFEACRQGHVDVARYLLDQDANIDAPTETTSDSALTWACFLGNEAIVELLLERMSDVEHRNKDGCTALIMAALAGHVKVAAMLLDRGAKINVESESNKDSPLTFACGKGHCDVVELLLERNANIEYHNKEGLTPLMLAAREGHADVAQKLLERMSDVEHRNEDGCTALIMAAFAGHVKVAAMLLDHGAKINVESDSNKDSPLTFACQNGHCDVVELLLKRNANIEYRNKEGLTPLMLAALRGHTDVVQKLLKRKANVNVPSGSSNDIPLTSACWKGHHDVVKLLLEFNSDIEHCTKDGFTPLMLAAWYVTLDICFYNIRKLGYKVY